MPTEATAETDISEVQLMRAGKFKYYDASELDITPDIFRQMKKNFDGRVKKVDLAIDYAHSSHLEAAGWIKEVVLKENDTQLWIRVDWTEAAKAKILSREFRYLSADFDRDYEDNETGNRYGYTLNGGGLTNRPFIKGMSEILSEIVFEFSGVDLSDEKRQAIERILAKGTKTMEFSDLKKEVFSLSDDQKKEMVKLCGGDQSVALSELAKERDTLKADVVRLSDEVSKQKKEAEFSVLMSEGRAVEAQKAAFMSGDMAAFVKLAVPVNLSEHGHGRQLPAGGGAEPKTPAEAQAELVKLSDEMMKSDKNLTFADVSLKIMERNPKLVELASKF